MAIRLFKRNVTVCRRAAAVLDSCGKAAVIHHAGAGKSCIAFRIFEDDPNERMVWLSSGEYTIQSAGQNLLKDDPEHPLFLNRKSAKKCWIAAG